MMGLYKVLIAVLSVCLISFTSWGMGKPPLHHLAIYNCADEKTDINVKGVRLYALKEGPQEFKSAGNPNGLASWTTRGSLYFTYPVEVVWRSEKNGKSAVKKFYTIPGVTDGANKITTGGTLAVRITPNFEAEILFAPDYKGTGIIDEEVIEYQFDKLKTAKEPAL
jgi:hypothetical protein